MNAAPGVSAEQFAEYLRATAPPGVAGDSYDFPMMNDDEFVHAWATLSPDARAEVPEGIKIASFDRYNRLMGTPTSRPVLPAPETPPADVEPEESWPEPVDIFGGAAVPPLPLDALPEVVGLWATEHACASGFDAGSYAYCALVAASALIDHRARLVITDGFAVPPFMWGAFVDFSGGGKSPIQDAALAPIVAANNDMVKGSRAAAQAHERDNAGRKPAEREDAPPWKQILTNNATIEGLTTLLQDNPSGVLLHSDELTEWLGRMDAYNAGSGKDRAAFLSAFNGGSVTVNRAKGNVFVPSFSLAIIGGIQPVRVAELLSRSGAGDGLVQRFLPYCPAAPDAVTYGTIDAAHVDAYRDALRTLIGWTQDATFMQTNAGLDPPAREQHRDYHNALRQLTKTMPPGRFVEHLHKLPGLAGRVAFALHALECAAENFWRPTVTAETHGNALRLMRVFYRHAEAMYEVIDSTQERSRTLARSAAETILARTLHVFSWSDLTRYAAHWQAEDESVRQAALDRLIELDWIMDVTPARAPGRRGRASAGKFAVNPRVHDAFSTHADRVRSTRRQRAELLRSLREAN